MTREEKVLIFEDTEKMYNSHPELVESVKKSKQNQKLILENDLVESDIKKYDKPAKVIVSKKRSLEAAESYKLQKVCVLNFASATNPGGGVTKGANAQEDVFLKLQKQIKMKF